MQEAIPPKKFRIDEAVRRRKIRRTLWIVGILLAVAAGVWLIGWLAIRSAKNAPGISYQEVGREHIDLHAPVPKPYDSNPPSSGAHYPTPANWGVYDYEINDKIFIHNLEHGGIWIAYRPNVPAKVIEDLKGIVKEFGGSKIAMAPRSANDADIAIVAWTRVLKFNLDNGALSDKQKDDLRAFYRAFKNHGPEFVPEDMGGVDPKSIQ
ncbi:MAG: DUF3105 domain-containing protein [Candidatus Sungbacteria bacterium]|nr:DUF3105 domain-containing protein [Candidatus Sungbacteria bacterium]